MTGIWNLRFADCDPDHLAPPQAAIVPHILYLWLSDTAESWQKWEVFVQAWQAHPVMPVVVYMWFAFPESEQIKWQQRYPWIQFQPSLPPLSFKSFLSTATACVIPEDPGPNRTAFECALQALMLNRPVLVANITTPNEILREPYIQTAIPWNELTLQRIFLNWPQPTLPQARPYLQTLAIQWQWQWQRTCCLAQEHQWAEAATLGKSLLGKAYLDYHQLESLADWLHKGGEVALAKLIQQGLVDTLASATDVFQSLYHHETWITPERYNQMLMDAFRRCFEYLKTNRIEGWVLEFGTYKGHSARLFGQLMQEFELGEGLALYDTFSGLPAIDSSVDQNCYEVAQHNSWFYQSMAVDPNMDWLLQKKLAAAYPQLPVKVIKGHFAETLPQGLPIEPAALIHLDCDLYQSAATVLHALATKNLFQDGCLLILDDYHSNRANPLMGERRALQEFLTQQTGYHVSPFFGYGWGAEVFFVHTTV